MPRCCLVRALVWRDGARSLPRVRLLVLGKARDPDVGAAFDLVADDHSLLRESRQERLHVDLVRGEDRHLDPLRAILETPLAVRHCQQAEE